jgi:hypothetical protein
MNLRAPYYLSFLIGIFLLLSSAMAFSQNNTLSFRFVPILNGQELTLGAVYDTIGNSSVQVDLFRFYISNLVFSSESGSRCEFAQQYFLIDAEHPESMVLQLPQKHPVRYDKIEFDLGLDSLTNVSGAIGGALDPTSGMYWTWQSGYINLKLEGTTDEVTATPQPFQFHLGGYAFPNATIQHISLDQMPSNDMIVFIDLDAFFIASPPLLQGFQSNVMSPGPMAVALSKRMAQSFQKTR